MRAITADLVLMPEGLIPNLVLRYDPQTGEIHEVLKQHEYRAHQLTKVSGILCPGFVNAHCHLELSHLAGKIPRHTGMVGFILALQKVRATVSDADRHAAILTAAQQMWDLGIQAVGDICNGTESLAAKKSHPQMTWHNFIELFGSNPEHADSLVERGQSVASEFGELPTSLTPHAPYSVSEALKTHLYKVAEGNNSLLSIHLLESKEEVQLFTTQDGPFLDFYRLIGQEFQAAAYPDPLSYMQKDLPEAASGVIWVHNTEMNAEQVERAIHQSGPTPWLCLCPKANAFIHDQLPPQSVFGRPELAKQICIGTDSLAGNDTLDLLEEIKTLQVHWHEIATATLLNWATLNGAKALGFDQTLGSFAPGKNPGILHIHPFDLEADLFLPETRTTRIV